MTACVNKKHTGKVAAVVTASLVGALSLGVAAPAFAATPDKEETPTVNGAFSGNEFTWNVQPNKDGKMVVEAGTQLTLDNIVDWQTNGQVPLDAVTVYYVTDGHGTLSTTAPDKPGDYSVVVLNGTYPGYSSLASIQGIPGYNDLAYVMDFTVAPKSLDGAYAFQNGDIEDKSFMFTGNVLDIAFAAADGTELDADDVEVKVTDGSGAEVTGSIRNAGKYHVVLTGADGGDYDGETENFDFTVDKINLDDAVITIDPVEAGDNSFTSGQFDREGVRINGELIAPGVIDAAITGGSVWDGDAEKWVEPSSTAFAGAKWGNVILDIDINESANVEGDSTEAHVSVVKDLVDNYYYDDEPVAAGAVLRFEAGDAAFDPAKISAAASDGAEDLDIDVTVYDADGEELPADYDYTQIGTYTVKATVKVDESTYEFGGSRTFTVKVVGKRFGAAPKVYASIDGKTADGAVVEYDAKAVVPNIVVKAGSATLVAGEDYTVAYKDAEGNVVEEMVEPGEYEVVIDYGNSYFLQNGQYTTFKPSKFSFTVTKADIDSAKADAEFYRYTGETIKPTFTAYTNDDLTGLSVAVDASKVNLTYHKVKTGSDGKPLYVEKLVAVTVGNTTYFRWEKELQVEAAKLQASDLVDAGWYVADVYVSNDDAHFTGTCQSEPFEVVSSYAHFSDVSSDYWAAENIYAANELGYMTGIGGTDLFMPEANITRAQLAKVFANMAGHVDNGLHTPSKFDDVNAMSWYAECVAWASEAGIVTGYDDTTFGPEDNATREQVAVMLYRYAAAQGKDVTVEDADATLAAYKDADQVADWAKDAMAWSVENGIFGVDTDELWAKQNIKRSAVATIAVRFQPEALPEA